MSKQSNRRRKAKTIQGKAPMIHATPMPVQWEGSNHAAIVATEPTPTPTPTHRPEDLAYEKLVANIELTTAPYACRIAANKLANIQGTAKIKAVELKSEAIENTRSLAWLDGQFSNIQTTARNELSRAANSYRNFSNMKTLNHPKVIEASFCNRLRIPEVGKLFDEQTLDRATAPEFRNYGLQQLLFATAAENGYDLQPGERLHGGNLRSVLKAAFSTHTLTTMLTNVTNKILLAGFEAVGQPWRQVAETKNVKDFKSTAAFRLTSDLTYEELAPGGEIAHGTLGQESYTIQARTYAKMLSLTRVDLINDDLGAFDAIRTRLGLGAAIKLNRVFWSMWMDNSTFFTAARGNYQEGGATTLDATGLDSAVALFRAMEGTDGNPLGLEPKFLIVPPALESTALILFKSMEVRDTTATQVYPTSNGYFNRFEPIVVPELGNSDITGNSNLSWYLGPAHQ